MTNPKGDLLWSKVTYCVRKVMNPITAALDVTDGCSTSTTFGLIHALSFAGGIAVDQSVYDLPTAEGGLEKNERD